MLQYLPVLPWVSWTSLSPSFGKNTGSWDPLKSQLCILMPWSQFADLQNGQILELQLYMALPGNLDVGRRGCCVCKDAGFTVFIYPGFLQFPYWVLLLCRLGTSQLSGGHLRWNFYASYSSVLHPGSSCPLDPVLSQALSQCENHVVLLGGCSVPSCWREPQDPQTSNWATHTAIWDLPTFLACVACPAQAKKVGTFHFGNLHIVFFL